MIETTTDHRPSSARCPRRPRRLRAAAAALAALATLLVPVVPTARAQERVGETAEGQGIFVDTVNVNLVNVDVYVTDDEGEPVRGLTADDFEVYEQKRLQKITNFYAVDDNQVVARSSGPATEVAPEAGETAGETAEVAEPEPLPEDEQLHLVVYIDNYNLMPFNRRRVLIDVRSFLRDMTRPGDRVMLVSYDRSLHVRRNFTGDVKTVVEALFELDEISAQGVHQASERRDVLQRIRESDSGNQAIIWAKQYAESVRNDLEFSIDAMKDIVTSLAGIPGRKAILYVSDGLPMIPGEDVFYYINQKFSDSPGVLTQMFQYDTSRRFEELVAQANANRVSFYTIDAAGLRVNSSASAEVAGGEDTSLAGGIAFIDSIRTQNLQSPIQMIAERTGGTAIINRNRVRTALDRVAQDFRSYYSLGYSPAHSGDGRYYDVEVKLKDAPRGWTVRHRAGYRDKTPQAQMNDGVLAALHFPYYSNPMGVELDVEPGQRRGDGFYQVPVHVKVPLDKLVLVPQGETMEARARLFFAALDDKGGVSPVQEEPLPISLSQAELSDGARSSHYTYTVTLLMRGGGQKLAVGVRDEIASENSFVSRYVSIGGR